MLLIDIKKVIKNFTNFFSNNDVIYLIFLTLIIFLWLITTVLPFDFEKIKTKPFQYTKEKIIICTFAFYHAQITSCYVLKIQVVKLFFLININVVLIKVKLNHNAFKIVINRKLQK